MTRRSLDDWKNLVQEQITSGLSVPKFCAQHKLSATYFYGRKSQLLHNSSNTKFIQASITQQCTTYAQDQQPATFTIKLSKAELSLPGDTSARFLSELLKGLAS